MPVFDVIVFATISAAVACWALGEVRQSRGWWTAGAALAVIHSVMAIGMCCDWSPETARVLTVQQTKAATGIEFAGGIYVNYAFLAVWLGDAAWWWLAPRRYARRPPMVSALIRGFMFFVIVNGAVIFADGWARVVGIVSTLAVLIAWFRRRSSHHGALSTAG